MSRVSHLRRLAGAQLLPWAVGVWAVFGTLTQIRDNFLDPDVRQRWDTFGLLPHWSIASWLAVGLGILSVGVFEGSYRLESIARDEIDLLRRRSDEAADDEWTGLADTFFADNGDHLSPINHVARLRQHFDELFARATGGDTSAARRLVRLCPKLNDASRKCYASSVQYAMDAQRIQRAINAFGTQAKAVAVSPRHPST